MAMFCGHCGAKREKKDKFCMQCGAPFGNAGGPRDKEPKEQQEASMSVEPGTGMTPGMKGRQLLLLAGGVLGVALVIVGVFMLAKKLGGGDKAGESAASSGGDPMQACIKAANDTRDEGKRDSDKAKLDQAVRMMEDCAKAHPEQAIIHWYLGETYQDAGRPCDGLKAYEKAAELWATDANWGPQARDRANQLRPTCGKK
jgi:cytochrome c-type biogenesis protein CcmH/NrfG